MAVPHANPGPEQAPLRSAMIDGLVDALGSIADFSIVESPDGVWDCVIESRTTPELHHAGLVGLDGDWFDVSIDGIVEWEPFGADADREVLVAIWSAVTGGAGRWQVGFRTRWILGDHAATARTLTRFDPILLDGIPPWPGAEGLEFPETLLPVDRRHVVFPGRPRPRKKKEEPPRE